MTVSQRKPIAQGVPVRKSEIKQQLENKFAVLSKRKFELVAGMIKQIRKILPLIFPQAGILTKVRIQPFWIPDQVRDA
jgi:hypothetical protein